jgi:hypothetical protein
MIMSAFIVTTETMQRVVDAIDKHSGLSFWGDIVINGAASLDAIGNALFVVNAEAVNFRYSGIPQEPPAFRYRPLGHVPTEHHFMAISCLLYQCDEGNVPDCDAYKRLERLRDRLAFDIAQKVARSAGALWDWPER